MTLSLFDSNGFREVFRLIDRAAVGFCDIICKELQRHDLRRDDEQVVHARHKDHIVRLGIDGAIALERHTKHARTARLDLFDVAHGLVKQRLVARDGDDETVLLNERDRAMLELARSIGLRVQVGDLLELQRTLHADGVVHIAADEATGYSYSARPAARSAD